MDKKHTSILHKFRSQIQYARDCFLHWQSRHISRGVLLVVISMLIGLLAGISAVSLKKMVRFFNDLIILDAHRNHMNYRFLIFPLVGVMLTYIFQRYVVGHNFGRCTRQIKINLKNKQYNLSDFTIFNPIVGCSLTMGFGASGGTEGPVALSGSAIGSVLGRWLKVSDDELRILVGVGAGAGIAAIFKSPMGGTFFALEVLQMQFTTLPIMCLATACLVAGAMASFLSNYTFDIAFYSHPSMNLHHLGWIVIFGVFCGLYCVYYNITKNYATRRFVAIKNRWLAALISGGLLSVSVFMFPQLFGEGFGIITPLVNDGTVSFTSMGIFAELEGIKWVYIAVIAILLLKGILVSASNTGGGVAGDFVPTLFAGSVAGFLFATAVNDITGLDLPVWYFSLIGMGCVMAGTVNAPIMAIFILCETTDTYLYLFPYLIAIGICYATVKIIRPNKSSQSLESDSNYSISQSSVSQVESHGVEDDSKGSADSL